LAARYVRRADVINRGYSGYTTRWGLRMLEDTFPKGQVAMATVFFGANDSVLHDRNPRQHVPLAEYEDNVSKILQYALASGARPIAIAPPPVDAAAWAKFRGSEFPDRDNENTRKYAEAVVRAASALGVPSINLWTLMQDANPDGAWKGLLSDGLHFNAGGNTFLFQQLVETIGSAESLKGLRVQVAADGDVTSPLANRYPLHSDVTEDMVTTTWTTESQLDDFFCPVPK